MESSTFRNYVEWDFFWTRKEACKVSGVNWTLHGSFAWSFPDYRYGTEQPIFQQLAQHRIGYFGYLPDNLSERCLHPFTTTRSHLLPRHNAPSPNHVIRVPRKQRLPVRAPRQTHTLRLPTLLPHGRIFGLQFINLALLLEVEDDDGARRGSTQPVSVGREDQSVDFVAGSQRIEVLGLVQVPEHGCAVFAAGGAEGAVGGDGYGVDVAGVTDVVGLDAAGGEFPDLSETLLAKTCQCKHTRQNSGFLIVSSVHW